MRTIKYWQNLVSMMNETKEKITKKCLIGDTCFTSLTTIGGNLYTRHANNLNHVHKDIQDILSVIIKLGIDFNGGETFFMMERI